MSWLADALDDRLLNDFQHGFPLYPRPYAVLGDITGVPEQVVLTELGRLVARGLVSRIGATIAPGRIGAATLAALAVPAERLTEVAELVSRFREVNHNYEREHHYNLWFVVTAPSAEQVRAVVEAVEARAGCGRALDLPMRRAFHLDLGFELGGDYRRRARPLPPASRYTLASDETRLLAALQDGLELTPRPYAELGARAQLSEGRTLELLEGLLTAGVIRRLGVIVRHREAGYCANAMAVWDVPEPKVDEVGRALAASRSVSLVYERRRAPPAWPYNLYCMLHGTDRAEVEERVRRLSAVHGLGRYAHALLFSRRCFKQCAARYVD